MGFDGLHDFLREGAHLDAEVDSVLFFCVEVEKCAQSMLRLFPTVFT